VEVLGVGRNLRGYVLFCEFGLQVEVLKFGYPGYALFCGRADYIVMLLSLFFSFLFVQEFAAAQMYLRTIWSW